MDPQLTVLTRPGTIFEIAEEDVRGNSMPVFKNRMRSLREALENSSRFGDRTYLVDGEARLSFAEHLRLVGTAARALRRCIEAEAPPSPESVTS